MATLGQIPRDLDDRLVDFVELKSERVILIANNSLIHAGTVNQLALSDSDLLVQFNLCKHFDLFETTLCHKLHVFNQGDGKWWGFSSGPAPAHNYLSQTSSSLVFLFKRYMSSAVKAYLQTHAGAVKGGLIRNEDLPNNVYIGDKGNSIGFLTVGYFRYVNVLRFLKRLPALKIVLVGFTGKYPPGGAWSGHDFGYEQRAYAVWADLIKLDHDGREEIRAA